MLGDVPLRDECYQMTSVDQSEISQNMYFSTYFSCAYIELFTIINHCYYHLYI